MARPRVFVSSTYYDLRHIRASLERFVESLGYDVILSEKGNIAFNPEIPLDESCYREVQNTDIFVLVVGGRYGTEMSESRGSVSKEFYERHDSITKGEYRRAVENNIPLYVLVDKYVYADYETYLQNKSNSTVVYPHVDSVNVFLFVDEILSQVRNNALQQFDRYIEIENWLREQWAGLFRDMLARASSQRQIASLASQVAELSEVNKTLKKYLEEVVSKLDPDKAAGLIESESKRLEKARENSILTENDLGRFLLQHSEVSPEKILKAIKAADSVETFGKLIREMVPSEGIKDDLDALLLDGDLEFVRNDLNEIRRALNLPPWPVPHGGDVRQACSSSQASQKPGWLIGLGRFSRAPRAPRSVNVKGASFSPAAADCVECGASDVRWQTDQASANLPPPVAYRRAGSAQVERSSGHRLPPRRQSIARTTHIPSSHVPLESDRRRGPPTM